MTYTPLSPLPAVRHDIEAYEYAPGLVLLYDDSGYAESQLSVPIEIVEYLSHLDGTRNAQFFARQGAIAGRSFSIEDFLGVIERLDEAYFLDSPRFASFKAEHDKEFNQSGVRPPAHAGTSYPDDPDELRAMLDGLLAARPVNGIDHGEPVAVVAPHIDFRVGGESYGPAYTVLSRSTADTFVVFGTSHRMSYDDFMISEKGYDTPLGLLPADREFIAHFRNSLPFEISRDESAHRREHSIEFQAVFLRHIFPDRDIRIVPILTGSLYEYVELGRKQIRSDEKLTQLYDALESTAEALGRKICYIAGADMSHIGKKFGDEMPARQLLPDVRKLDSQALEKAAGADADGFLGALAAERNRFRVCGVAPIYATLRAAKPTRGELLCYDEWDEIERESAVTFASLAFYR